MDERRNEYPYTPTGGNPYPRQGMMPRQPGYGGPPQTIAYPQQTYDRGAMMVQDAQVLTQSGFKPLLLYKSPKTEAASRGAGQLIAKVVQWKGNGLTDHPKSFALATESVSQPSIVQRSICAGRVPSGTLESANR